MTVDVVLVVALTALLTGLLRQPRHYQSRCDLFGHLWSRRTRLRYWLRWSVGPWERVERDGPLLCVFCTAKQSPFLITIPAGAPQGTYASDAVLVWA